MLYPKKNDWIFALLAIALVAMWGGVIYRVYALNNIGIALALASAAASFFIIQSFRKNAPAQLRLLETGLRRQRTVISYIIFLTYLILILACFIALWQARTFDAIISPWQKVTVWFFAGYAAATAALFALVRARTAGGETNRLGWISGLSIFLHFLLSFSVAAVVYGLGYGFDPFVHQATEKLIANTGAVDPKPFYYLGHYALAVITHKITGAPIVWVDRLLVPFLAALFIPVTVWQSLKTWFDDNKSLAYLIIMLLALPFPIFIISTPQNLAYLFFLLAVILGLSCTSLFDFILICVLALAAFVTQPIAGIPAALYCALLAIYHSDRPKIKPYLYAGVFLLAAFALPLAFYAFENPESASPDAGEALAQSLNLSVPGSGSVILNFLYFYIFNIPAILSILSVLGIYIAWRNKKNCRLLLANFLLASGLLISYFLTKRLPFAFLINYERGNFSNRILIATVIVILPFIIISIYSFLYRLAKSRPGIAIPFAAFAIALICASLYASYPRFDRYFNSHGYSVSQADIAAVRWIEADAGGSDYVVLANQQVSAAALREFGFKKYYQAPVVDSETNCENANWQMANNVCRMTNADGNNLSEIQNSKFEIFYYPIPTGGPLYQYYLDMVYKKPSRDTVLAAMDLTGVDTAYFVLNKYWWAFPKVLSEAKLEADTYKDIGNGQNYIFKYRIPTK